MLYIRVVSVVSSELTGGGVCDQWQEGVARTWEEQEARNRTARRLQLDSERAFPTLGADSTKAQLSSMKAPTAKAVATKNVWASLDHDEDSD